MTGNRYRGRRGRSFGEWCGDTWDSLTYAMVVAWPAIKAITIIAALTGTLYGGWLAAKQSPYFTIRHLTVTSTPHVSESHIQEKLGLTQKNNIFEFDAPGAQATLLAHPWVSRAEVKKILPNRLEVRVSERRPEGILVLGQLYLVDGEGRPFVSAGADDMGHFPMVTGIHRAEIDHHPETAFRKIRNGLAVVRMFKTFEVSSHWRLGSVNIDQGERINLMLGSTRVGLGSDNFAEKLGRLNQISI